MIVDDDQLKYRMNEIIKGINQKQIRMNQIFVEQEKLNQELQTLKEDIIREDGKVKALKNIWDTEIHGESNFDVVKEKAAKAKVLGG